MSETSKTIKSYPQTNNNNYKKHIRLSYRMIIYRNKVVQNIKSELMFLYKNSGKTASLNRNYETRGNRHGNLKLPSVRSNLSITVLSSGPKCYNLLPVHFRHSIKRCFKKNRNIKLITECCTTSYCNLKSVFFAIIKYYFVYLFPFSI